MALWFLRGLRQGVVTTRYPVGPVDAWTGTLLTPPAFHSAGLTAAAANKLAELCPSGALRRDGGVLVYDVGACTACGRCVAALPAVAVPSGALELAAIDRQALVKRIPIRAERP